MHEAAPDPARPLWVSLDLETARFGALRTPKTAAPPRTEIVHRPGVSAIVDPARSGGYWSRVVVHDAFDAGDLDALWRLVGGGGPPRQVDVVAGAMTTDLGERLAGAALERAYALSWQSAATPDGSAASDARISRWGPARADAFLDLIVDAPIDPEIRAARREHYCTDRFRVFVAESDGVPVAWATTFVACGTALLGNAFTAEPHRRQGIHQALLDARLRDAAALGIAHVFTDVEPDTGSDRNCARAGFAEVARVAVHTRRGP